MASMWRFTVAIEKDMFAIPAPPASLSVKLPLAFMRGRTLAHAFVIVDEAQNASRLQMKMVLTRLGEGARMVVTGDPSQVDLPHPGDSGLAHATRILDGVQGVAVARFEASDVVRHPMVERIVKAYEADAQKR